MKTKNRCAAVAVILRGKKWEFTNLYIW
jgi:hypothetical protein